MEVLPDGFSSKWLGLAQAAEKVFADLARSPLEENLEEFKRI